LRTSLPTFTPISCATRWATEMAATRLGCVTAMHPPCRHAHVSPRHARWWDRARACGLQLKGGSRHVKQQITLAMPDCRRNWGSCVDFPLPVSPTSIVVSCVRMSCKSSWRTSAIGRRFEASCNALAFLPLACPDINHNSVALTLALV
jgi:hypothetical protein